jgi:hypothetical protein
VKKYVKAIKSGNNESIRDFLGRGNACYATCGEND